MENKYIEYQQIDQKLKQLSKQMQAADEQLMEIMATIQSLDDYSDTEDGREVLVPLNNGIFTKARLNKEDKLLVNVGSSVVVDKSVAETKKLIEEQKNEMEKIRRKMSDQVDALVKKASELETELK